MLGLDMSAQALASLNLLAALQAATARALVQLPIGTQTHAMRDFPAQLVVGIVPHDLSIPLGFGQDSLDKLAEHDFAAVVSRHLLMTNVPVHGALA